MLNPLCEHLKSEHNIEYTPVQIRKMISTSITTGSSTFSLKITNTSAEHAYIIADYIASNAPAIVKEYTDINSTPLLSDEKDNTSAIEKMRVLNTLKPAITLDSPNLTINLLIAAAGTAIIVYALFLLKYMFNTVVATEEDIKNITDKYPIIGIIPKWE
jgi:capsular polysaccharide biosynthesis protein